MSARRAAVTLLMAGFALRQVSGLRNLRRSLGWLSCGDRSLGPSDSSTGGSRLVVILPVYSEQDTVTDALDYFDSLSAVLSGVAVVVVTTELDRLRPRSTGRNGVGSPTTQDVVARYLDEHPDVRRRVASVHYGGTGRKAAQVNHAFDALGLAGCDWLVVYDVDSRPSPASLDRLLAAIVSSPECPVVQQSAVFGVTPGAVGVAGSVLRGAADLQTLWTLRREIPSFRRYAEHNGVGGIRGTVRRGLAQTVGHGIAVRADVFAQVGGMPTSTRLDDLPFGYRLTVHGVEIAPLRALTTALVPGGVAAWIGQGARWFDNYLDYWICRDDAARAGTGTTLSRWFCFAVGWYRGVTWLARSPLTAAALVVAVRSRRWVPKVLAIVGLCAGFVESPRLLCRFRGEHGPGAVVRSALRLTVATLLSSSGPALAVCRWLAGSRWQGDALLTMPGPEPASLPRLEEYR